MFMRVKKMPDSMFWVDPNIFETFWSKVWQFAKAGKQSVIC